MWKTSIRWLMAIFSAVSLTEHADEAAEEQGRHHKLSMIQFIPPLTWMV